MNLQSFGNFGKMYMEPGSYLYRNRFLKVFKKALPGFCMGTRFLPIQEPVPECKKSQFANFNTGNSVPTYTGTGSHVLQQHFCYFLTALCTHYHYQTSIHELGH